MQKSEHQSYLDLFESLNLNAESLFSAETPYETVVLCFQKMAELFRAVEPSHVKLPLYIVTQLKSYALGDQESIEHFSDVGQMSLLLSDLYDSIHLQADE